MDSFVFKFSEKTGNNNGNNNDNTECKYSLNIYRCSNKKLYILRNEINAITIGAGYVNILLLLYVLTVCNLFLHGNSMN